MQLGCSGLGEIEVFEYHVVAIWSSALCACLVHEATGSEANIRLLEPTAKGCPVVQSTKYLLIPKHNTGTARLATMSRWEIYFLGRTRNLAPHCCQSCRVHITNRLQTFDTFFPWDRDGLEYERLAIRRSETWDIEEDWLGDRGVHVLL